jgi:hypothetical protein
MPCPIEIRKVIENSINELLPNPDAAMSESAANKIVKELNTTWSSPISRVAPYSGDGGAFVKINSLEDAVQKEYKRQLEAEKAFERDFDFFRGDEPLLEQEQRDLFLQRAAPVKPGVQEIFNQNPTLASIGTPEQYSAYLDSIFPDSRVRDVVYRGGEKEDVKLFQYWTNNPDEAYLYAKAHVSKGGQLTERNPIPAISKNLKNYFDSKYGEGTFDVISLMDSEIQPPEWMYDIDMNTGEYFLKKEYEKEFEELEEKYKNKPKILSKLNDEDVKLIDSFETVKSLYPYVKIESESDLMKQYDDESYINNIGEYKKARRYIDNVIGIEIIRKDIGKIKTAIINIKNPYTEEIRQEDLQDDRDAYRNGHDGAFLMDGDHFLIKSNTNQIHILGNENDVQGFREFVNKQGAALQKPQGQTLPSNASPATLKLIRDFLERVGVNVNVMKDIVVNGVKYDANGVAQITQQLISVVEGKEAQTLPEEAMHFAVAIIKQTDKKLYQKLLKEINGYDMLNKVFAEYGNDPLYQIDGKPDVIKLKEEAIAKVLVEKIINRVDGFAEKPENLTKVQSWWRDILDFLKSLIYQKSGFDQAAINIISGKEIGTANDIREKADTEFLQKSKQDNVYDKLKETSSRIGKPKLVKRPDGTQEERYFIDGVEIPVRVSDISNTYYKNQKDLLKDEYDNAVDELRREKGTKGHADLEHAFTLFVDENGYLRSEAIRKYNIDNDVYVSQLGDQKFYKILVNNLQERLVAIDEANGGNTRFLSEITIYNGKQLGGTVDLMAISMSGKVEIFDWKFMNLNTEKYKDVPPYKIESWNIQMNEYKKILIANYGVALKDFGQTRMIPILAEYVGGKRDKEGNVIELPKLTGVKIGTVNVKAISDEADYLLPVPTQEEFTGNPELDELIKKLNVAYKRFAEENVPDSRRLAKREQLDSLFKAIRRLQVKQDVKPLIEQAELLKIKINDFYKKYETLYKNPQDLSKITEEEMDSFSEESEGLIKTLDTYRDIHLLLENIVDSDTRNKLRDIADSAVTNIKKITRYSEDFVADIVAKKEKVNDILAPEKIVRGITKAFASTSTIQVKSIELLFKKANKALGRATLMTQTEAAKLNDLRDKYTKWASSKGLSQKDFFSVIKKKDKNELIDQYDVEFYKKLKKATRDKDYAWIRDNVDKAVLNEEIQKELAKEIDRIQKKPRLEEPEVAARIVEFEINNARKLYSIDTETSPGWLMRNIARKAPLQKWETQEWKNLNRPENSAAKEFYEYIIEKNNEYAELGYISKERARIFLPYVQGSVMESVIKGEKLALADQFWSSISVDAGDVGYGQLDPETGKPINTIPKYFTTEFKGVFSEDLFRTMLLYNEAALRYKYLSEIENQVKSIARVERNKKSIMTSSLSKVKKDKYGDPIYEENTEGNYELLDSMIKSIIYGQKYVDNQDFDAAITKLGTWGKTLNEKIGLNIFPESLDEKVITISKLGDTLNRMFSITTLGLNIGSSVSNLFGGTMQSIINSGKYFTEKDFFSAQMQLTANKFNNEDANKYMKAFEYFVPLTDSYTRDLAKKLSTNVVTAQGVQDFLMWMMKTTDRSVQAMNFLSYLNNSIIMDGKVVNAREYLRSLPEYKGKYSGSSEDRKAFNEKFENDVKQLIEEKGVMKLATVENGQLVIPGVDRISDSVLELRRQVQQLSKDAMGNLSDDDVRKINMTIIGNSFMVFKNWIPRPLDMRFGAMKYNAGADAYEWGRMRTLISFLWEGISKNREGLVGLVTGNDAGIKLMREAFERQAEKYERETGRKLEMDEALFMDLYKRNLAGVAKDLAFLMILLALTIAIKAAVPDDDEDPAVTNQFRYAARLSDKLLDEIMYFYNPTSILNLVGSGPFPAVSLINNGTKAIGNFLKEMFAIGVGDEELEKDTKVIKYIMRTFPFTNQMTGYLPLIYPDVAKDLGIRVQSNYGIR